MAGLWSEGRLTATQVKPRNKYNYCPMPGDSLASSANLCINQVDTIYGLDHVGWWCVESLQVAQSPPGSSAMPWGGTPTLASQKEHKRCRNYCRRCLVNYREVINVSGDIARAVRSDSTAILRLLYEIWFIQCIKHGLHYVFRGFAIGFWSHEI